MRNGRLNHAPALLLMESKGISPQAMQESHTNLETSSHSFARCQNLTLHIGSARNRTMNVSLPEQMEEFVRQKVAAGDYETASEVVREGLRLLKQRDDLWKAELRSKIKQGVDSIRAGRSIPAQQVKAEIAAFKKKWKRNRSLK
jgi:antitoxin ParD1/3/4